MSRIVVLVGFILAYVGIVGVWYGRMMHWIFNTQSVRMLPWSDRHKQGLVYKAVGYGCLLVIPIVTVIVLFIIQR